MTEIVLVGVNHKTAPVELREKLSFSENQRKQSLDFLRGHPHVSEAVVLSTCNRTEVYVSGNDPGCCRQAVLSLFAQVKGVNVDEVLSALYVCRNEEAVEHLFLVTAGLDSMILGETQILGQVKEAYARSCESHCVGRIFHALFRQAVTAAKRVQAETAINESAASVSYAAVELAKKLFRRLENRTVMLIGAGKMSELTLKHLHDQGVSRVVVVNRTHERAERLAACFGGISEEYEKRREWLTRADIVISSTGAPHLVLKKEDVAAAMRVRRGRPLFLIDIAVPRDIDPAVNQLDNVYLYDIDDLQAVVAANLKEREKEAQSARLIVAEEMAEFNAWLKTQQVVPLIAALRRKAENIRVAELNHSLKKLSNLSEKEKKHVDNLTRAIVNRILREPVLRIKELALAGHGDIYAASLTRLFDLESEDDAACADSLPTENSRRRRFF